MYKIVWFSPRFRKLRKACFCPFFPEFSRFWLTKNYLVDLQKLRQTCLVANCQSVWVEMLRRKIKTKFQKTAPSLNLKSPPPKDFSQNSCNYRYLLAPTGALVWDFHSAHVTVSQQSLATTASQKLTKLRQHPCWCVWQIQNKMITLDDARNDDNGWC